MIVNFGSMNIDYVYKVSHFVAPGETMSSDSMKVFPGGKGLNQSIAIARAGGSVAHCGYYAAEGVFLKTLLEENGVDVSKLIKADSANGHAIIQVDSSGENCILLYGGTNELPGKEYVDAVLGDIEKGSLILFQNETSAIGYAIKKAHEMGFATAINPAPMNNKVLDYPLVLADYIFLNCDEGRKLSGKSKTDEVLKALLLKYPKAKIIFTLGSKGAWYKSCEEEFFTKAYKAQRVVDTTAAGDTFVGYFLAFVDNGASEREAMEKAAYAAAKCVEKEGAASSIPFI